MTEGNHFRKHSFMHITWALLHAHITDPSLERKRTTPSEVKKETNFITDPQEEENKMVPNTGYPCSIISEGVLSAFLEIKIPPPGVEVHQPGTWEQPGSQQVCFFFRSNFAYQIKWTVSRGIFFDNVHTCADCARLEKKVYLWFESITIMKTR